jgi:hypothetical protein
MSTRQLSRIDSSEVWGSRHSERSQLAAMNLISFMFFYLAESMYPNLYLRLYPKSSSRLPVPTDHGCGTIEPTQGLDAAALENGEAVDQGGPTVGFGRQLPVRIATSRSGPAMMG